MILDALFTAKTNALIVEVLASGRALKAKDIYHEVSKEATLTYQAIHKQLKFLRAKGVVDKLEGTRKYVLNPEWVEKTSDFWLDTLKKYHLQE